jgi:hypothetical protein
MVNVAKRAAINVRNTQKRVRRLEADGWLTTLPSPGRRTNRYQINALRFGANPVATDMVVELANPVGTDTPTLSVPTPSTLSVPTPDPSLEPSMNQRQPRSPSVRTSPSAVGHLDPSGSRYDGPEGMRATPQREPERRRKSRNPARAPANDWGDEYDPGREYDIEGAVATLAAAKAIPA